MESDSWALLAAASRRHQSSIHTVFDAYLGFEEAEGGGDEARAEFACPYCSEDFDVFGLCCHIDDEHPLEAKNGVCPVCADRIGMDLVSHITTQHANYFKIHRRRRSRRSSSGSHSTLSLLKKELRDGHFHSVYGGSTYSAPSSSVAPDPLLSSFIYNLPHADSSKSSNSQSVDDETLNKKDVDKKVVESSETSLSEKDHKERSQRSAFVQELLLSTIFQGTL